MKKKILSFCLAFALIIPAIFLFSACGEKTNYYYTISTPEHCSFSAFSFATDKDGKTYLNKGMTFEGSVSIDAGWEIVGTLTLKINGEITDWTKSNPEGGYYYLLFTPSSDFNIAIEGNIVEKYCQVNFTKGEYAQDSDLGGLYIKFSENPTEETSLLTFLNSANTTKSIKYGEIVEFWVYTKGYADEPNISSYNVSTGTFYIDEANNEYGYHFYTIVETDCSYTFNGKTPTNISINTSEESSTSSFDNEKLTMRVEDGKLYIIFEDTLDTEILNQLTLTINGEIQDINLHAGTNEITLNRPYEYNIENPYHYNIDLNFYEIPYFDGIIN